MTWTVYLLKPGGILDPIGRSEHEGEAAIFDVLLRTGRGAGRYVALPDAEGVELEVRR